ncbi:phosphoribosylglycinamide formyltransferase [Elizabethkingia sp. JS20170427COW]|uniref:phosphoribosylglycinamide formyltransferase n=1 Tax=Elizabethkingia sp. JS20170427COW TaxID=2583851 RepID=UPI00111094E9|nr:phosphoribosylglycinamide formyltransferase [Elizabethkingia sp. JS20170427COW]QCX54253.1 phosphoribosylglycinamide formyltransferase [Elizabethkingia sp. JS20170427COW]
MKNLVVLVSGSGSNLQRILDTIQSGEIKDAQVSLVVADRECYGLERANNAGIEHKLIKRGKDFCNQLEEILPENTDLIVLAGFLSVMTEDFCNHWAGKIVNIHPSLLPKYGGKGMWGMHVHNAVKNAGETTTGATVHFVTPGVDEGEVILQQETAIHADDTPEAIAEKVHQIEYQIFPKAIQKVLEKI